MATYSVHQACVEWYLRHRLPIDARGTRNRRRRRESRMVRAAFWDEQTGGMQGSEMMNMKLEDANFVGDKESSPMISQKHHPGLVDDGA